LLENWIRTGETIFIAPKEQEAQETLRQKDRAKINSGKRTLGSTEGANLSGKQTDG
tara:strand:- start:679 stop:846 length:168 start_codon:yes stop_codon:yes gene_type:complete